MPHKDGVESFDLRGPVIESATSNGTALAQSGLLGGYRRVVTRSAAGKELKIDISFASSQATAPPSSTGK